MGGAVKELNLLPDGNLIVKKEPEFGQGVNRFKLVDTKTQEFQWCGEL